MALLTKYCASPAPAARMEGQGQGAGTGTRTGTGVLAFTKCFLGIQLALHICLVLHWYQPQRVLGYVPYSYALVRYRNILKFDHEMRQDTRENEYRTFCF